MALSDYVHEKAVIETARLRLRPMVVDDVPALREWMPDKALYAYWGKRPGKADRDPALIFERETRPSTSFHLGIEERASKKVVGELWVYKIEGRRMASVAIRVASSCQGRGFGTEALSAMVRFCFECTELRRLQAEVDVRNVASWRMLEKCGFRREGLVRQGKMVSSWCDYYLYGMLSSDLQEAWALLSRRCGLPGTHGRRDGDREGAIMSHHVQPCHRRRGVPRTLLVSVGPAALGVSGLRHGNVSRRAGVSPHQCQGPSAGETSCRPPARFVAHLGHGHAPLTGGKTGVAAHVAGMPLPDTDGSVWTGKEALGAAGG